MEENLFEEELKPDDECVFCGKLFEDSQHKLEEHVEKYHKKTKLLRCNICPRRFDHFFSLYAHLRYFHKTPKNHQCNVCKNAFRSKDNLILHLKRNHKGPNGYMCDICGEDFHSNNAFEIDLIEELQNHFKDLHDGDKPEFHECKLCGECFDRKIDLNSHVVEIHLEHQNIKLDNDDDIEKIEESEESSQDQQPSDHQVDEKYHQCDLSKNSCVQLSLLKQHIAIVHDLRKLPGCDFCERLYNTACKNVENELDSNLENESLLKSDSSTLDEHATVIKDDHVQPSNQESGNVEVSTSIDIKKPVIENVPFQSQESAEKKQEITVTYNNGPKVACNPCNKVFISCESLLDHMKQYHQKSNHQDEKVPMEIDNDLITKSPIQDQGKTSTYLSNESRYDSISKGEKDDLTSKNQGRKIYDRKWKKNEVCFICNMTLTNYLSYHDHFIKMHFKDKFETLVNAKTKPYFCKICPHKTNQKHNLLRHYSGKHQYLNVFIEEFKATQVIESVNQEVTVDDDISPVNDDLQPDVIDDKPKTTEVINIILNDVIESTMQMIAMKKHKCTRCGKRFFGQRDLANHRRTAHDHKKRVKCNVCNAMFAKSYIYLHMKIFHSSMKKYKCTICDKTFKGKFLLAMHNHAIHLGEGTRRIMKCKLCDFKYDYRKTNIENHMKRAHGEIQKSENAKKDFITTILLDLLDNVMEKVKLPKGRPTEKFLTHKCELCETVFNKKNKLKQHVIASHKSSTINIYKCNQCEESFTSVEKLAKHKTQSHNRQIRCNICDKKIGPLSLLSLHMKRSHGSIRYQCRKCDKTFMFQSRLKTHEQRFHISRENWHKCELCEKCFVNEERLSRHTLTIHNEVSQFQCEKCSVGFKSRENLNSHNIYYHSEDFCEHVCNLCPKRFRNVVSLEQHLGRKHKVKNEKCEQCDFECALKGSLEAHVKNKHIGFKCNYCIKTYPDKRQRQVHMEADHEGTATIKKCPKCNYTTPKHHQLLVHKSRVHGNQIEEKRYLCEFCQKPFSRKDNMKNHIKAVHNAIKDLYCDKCPLAFSRVDNLKKHLLTVHEETQSNMCDICGKAFNRSQDMISHIRNTHEQSELLDKICEFCGKGFRENNTLGRHIREIHHKNQHKKK